MINKSLKSFEDADCLNRSVTEDFMKYHDAFRTCDVKEGEGDLDQVRIRGGIVCDRCEAVGFYSHDLPEDFETCGECGYDHEYEYEHAHRAHVAMLEGE